MLALLETTTTTNPYSSYYTIGLLVLMLVAFYFLLIRPQRKKEKQAQDMRNNIEVGDGITTIGGIMGRVVSFKDDTVLIETGADRVKFRLKKWAIQEVEKIPLDE